MNNTFNIQRFGLLLKRQWLEYGKIYLISLMVILGVTITVYSFNIVPLLYRPINYDLSQRLNIRIPLFMILGFLFVTVIASSYFAHLGQKPKAIIDLMIPASTFEKFFAGVLFTSIVSTASFMLIFYLTDLAFITVLKNHVLNNEVSNVESFFNSKNSPNKFNSLYLAPFFVTSIFLLGSIYFEKFHYIKTAITLMIFCGIWTAIIAKAGKLLFSNRMAIDNNNHLLNEKSSVDMWLTLVLVLLTVVFWSITYVRLREKEV